MEIYDSENQAIMDALQANKRGSLYGLWTHSGNVVVQLAVTEGDTNGKVYCERQCLKEVGKFTWSKNDYPTRPDWVSSTAKYIWIVQERERIIHYNIESGGRLSVFKPGTLSYVSPFRYKRSPDGTYAFDLEEVDRSPSHHCQLPHGGLSSDHWATKHHHSSFLKELTENLRRVGLTVKQIQEPKSGYLALSIEYPEKDLRWGVGFPVEFPLEREVSIKGENFSAKKKLSYNSSNAYKELLEQMKLEEKRRR